MALARLTKQCHECPFVETCEHKEMEALGYLPEPIMADVKVPVTADIAAPILRETVSRVVDGKVVTMYKDELEKILYKDLYSHLCGLDYPCPHMPGLEEQVAMAHKLRKEIEKNG